MDVVLMLDDIGAGVRDAGDTSTDLIHAIRLAQERVEGWNGPPLYSWGGRVTVEVSELPADRGRPVDMSAVRQAMRWAELAVAKADSTHAARVNAILARDKIYSLLWNADFLT